MTPKSTTPASIDWKAALARLDAARAAIEATANPSSAAIAALLEARAKRLAKPAPELPGARQRTIGVQFRLAGEPFVIEAKAVLRVARLESLTPAPGAPPPFIGLTNVRGLILPVADLRVLLRLSTQGLTDLAHLIVLGEQTPAVGVLADRAYDVAELDSQSLSQPIASEPFVLGVDAQRRTWIDGRALLRDPRMNPQSTSSNPHPDPNAR